MTYALKTMFDMYFSTYLTDRHSHLWIYNIKSSLAKIDVFSLLKPFEVMTSTSPIGTFGSVAYLLAATLYQGNPDGNQKLWNIGSTEIYTLLQALLECCHIKMESSQWEKWNQKNEQHSNLWTLNWFSFHVNYFQK